MTVFSILGIIGCGVGVFQSVLDMTMVPYLADQYAAGSSVVKEVIIAFGVANPAIYIASLGLPGLWFIFVSVLAISNKSIPKLLVSFRVYVGCGEYCNGVCSCGGDYLVDLLGRLWGAMCCTHLEHLGRVYLLRLSRDYEIKSKR